LFGPFRANFGGPDTMARDPSTGRILLGDSSNCELSSLDPSTGDRSIISSDICPRSIAVAPTGDVAYVSNSVPFPENIEAIFEVDLATGAGREFSGPDRGDGLPLRTPAPALVFDPGASQLLALTSGIWSIAIPSGDRRRLLGGITGGAAAGTVDPRGDRRLLLLDPGDQLIEVDLDEGTARAGPSLPNDGAVLAVDGARQRVYLERPGFFEGGALLTMDLASGEWVVSAK